MSKIYNSNLAAIADLKTINAAQSTAIATLEAQVATPALQAIATSIEIFIDNTNGSDATTNPSLSTTPCKTFKAAIEFVKDNYYFTDAANNYLILTLISDYNFSFQESAIFDGSLITGSVSLVLRSNNSVPKLITGSAKQPIIFKNFSYELKLQTINFSSLSVVQIYSIPRVYTTLVSFYKLSVRICELFYDLTTASTFNGLTTFTNVDDVRFLATSLVKNLIQITKALNVYFGGQIDRGRFDLQQITSSRLVNNSSISETTLTTAGLIFNFRDVNEVVLSATLVLNSTSGINLCRFFNLTHVNTVRATTLTLVNMHSSSIVHKATALIKLIHSEATTLNISAGAGFKPVFVEENNTRKLLDLEYSAYSVGAASTPESILNTDIFSTTSRPVIFDKFSQFFEENILVYEIANLSTQVGELQAEIDSRIKGYKSTFSNNDLDGDGIYIAPHNLGTLITSVSIFDDTGEQIFPGEITRIDANAIAINLSAYAPINGNYTILICG
ncbi:MAG: hypothetical protein ACRCZS_12640 [Chroococcidiopsis sp.]